MSAARSDAVSIADGAILDALVIGSGLGGIAMAVRLKRKGIRNFLMLEKEGEVGGVWRDNVYPGCGCDVPAILYSFSFAPKHDWTRRYPPQAEIKRYIESVVDRFDVRRHLRFNEEVTALTFDDASGHWTVDTTRGQFRARSIISAVGQLNRPRIPSLPGLESFGGTSFHSARWRGDVDLKDKRVAVVGSGASAIQFVPIVAEQAEKLYLFQRTPPRVMPKPDRTHTSTELWRYRTIPLWQRLERLILYLNLERNVLRIRTGSKANEQFAERAAAVITEAVPDPEVRAKVMPDYPAGCNRTTLSNDWYPALCRQNVEVVTEGLSHIETDAIVTQDGTKRDVDAIIFATGFDAINFLAPMKVTGANGADLHEVWKHGAEAYKGISAPGFPNLFLMYGPNTNAYNSVLMMLEAQAGYIARCVRRVVDDGIVMDVRPEAARRFNDMLEDRISRLVWVENCRNWFKTAAGKVTTNWPGSTLRYRAVTARLKLGDYTLRRAGRGDKR